MRIQSIRSYWGSGTFILDFIHRKKKIFRVRPKTALENILNEVVMIDANILAVILGRINYLSLFLI